MDFIERIFHVAPDHGTGALEVTIVSVVLFAPLAIAVVRTIANWRARVRNS